MADTGSTVVLNLINIVLEFFKKELGAGMGAFYFTTLHAVIYSSINNKQIKRERRIKKTNNKGQRKVSNCKCLHLGGSSK